MKAFNKIAQIAAQTVFLGGCLWLILWLAQAIGDLLITAFPW